MIKKCENSVNKSILLRLHEAITNFVNKFDNKYIENVLTSGLILCNLMKYYYIGKLNTEKTQKLFF